MEHLEYSTRELSVSLSVEEADIDGRRCLVDVVWCTGEIDVMTEPDFRSALDLVTTPHMIVDLGGVTFMGAAGINALVDLARRRRGGTVGLRQGPSIIARLLPALDVPANLFVLGDE
jgi:anti-anti-sigma factor